MSGGLMAFQADGAWSKWLHVGWAAHGGVTAAELAKRNFRGPLAALDGPGNLYAALLAGEDCDFSLLTRGLSSAWLGGNAKFKIYPCAHVIQPYIDAALNLRRTHGFNPGDIAEIRCHVAPWAVPIVCTPRAAKIAPSTELDAIASLPYMVAVAIADREVTLAALDQASRQRTDLRALAQRITHVEDASLGQGFDARLELRLADGTTHVASAEAAEADADRLVAKFMANAEARLGAERVRQVALRLAAMPAPDPSTIAELFAADRSILY
jgi:2-methylcitrate dehydratase PrpD